MTQEEKNIIKEEIRAEFKNNQNGIFKKIMIGVISIVIAASGGSFLGVMTAQKVDRQKINNNANAIERVSTQFNKRCNTIETNINEIRDEQLNQWKYIIENSNTRGGEVNSTIKGK